MQINLRFVLETLWQKGRRQNLKPVLLSDPTAKRGMGDLQKIKLYVLASYQIRSLQNKKNIYVFTSEQVVGPL